METTMDCCESPTSSCHVAPRRCCSAARRSRPGPICRNSRAPPTAAIRGWSSSSCAARSTASPTVAPIGDPDYAGLHGSIALSVERTERGDACWTPSSRCIRRCRSSRGCTARSRPRSFTRWRPPIASVRISTGRTCSKAALPGRAGCNPAGSTARWKALPKGERVMSGLAIGPTTPLVLRGAAPTVGWAPVALPQAAEDTAMRLVELYRQRDPALAKALTQGLAARQGRAGRRHEAEARHQRRRRDAAGGARRRQADGGR